MEQALTLCEVKNALRIDYDDDDALLIDLINSALCRLSKDTQRPLSCLLDDDGKLPYDLKRAGIALVGHWFNNPEATTNQSLVNVEQSYYAVIRPYIKLV